MSHAWLFWRSSSAELFEQLDSGLKELSGDEARRRHLRDAHLLLKPKSPQSTYELFVRQLTSPITLYSVLRQQANVHRGLFRQFQCSVGLSSSRSLLRHCVWRCLATHIPTSAWHLTRKEFQQKRGQGILLSREAVL